MNENKYTAITRKAGVSPIKALFNNNKWVIQYCLDLMEIAIALSTLLWTFGN